MSSMFKDDEQLMMSDIKLGDNTFKASKKKSEKRPNLFINIPHSGCPKKISDVFNNSPNRIYHRSPTLSSGQNQNSINTSGGSPIKKKEVQVEPSPPPANRHKHLEDSHKRTHRKLDMTIVPAEAKLKVNKDPNHFSNELKTNILKKFQITSA